MAKKIKKEAPKPSSPAWMATFSDLMALLMTFFVLLFSFSTMDASKWAAIVSAFTGAYSVLDLGSGLMPMPDVSMTDAYDITPPDLIDQSMTSIAAGDWDIFINALEVFAEDYSGDTEVTIIGHPEYILVRFPNDLLFEPGMANLGDSAREMLAKLYEQVEPAIGLLSEFRIEGHTCDMPLRPGARYEDNWELSGARATSVRKYLTQVGLDETDGIILATGCGEFRPIADNGTLEGREANRRVDIILWRDLLAGQHRADIENPWISAFP